MPQAELLNLIEKRDISGFESRCMELLTGGQLNLGDLHLPLRKLQQAGEGSRVVTVAQMALEAAGASAEPLLALRVARIAFEVDGKNSDLRTRVSDLYQKAYGSQTGFDAAMEASGLRSGRPARNALRILDLCLNTSAGDTLMSRTDGHIVEVAEVDRGNSLFALKRGGRTSTLPLSELSREYEPIARDDFRVIRALWPDQLQNLIENDPVRLVAGILHAHGDQMDVDELKTELVPRYLTDGAWVKWWNSAKTLLKKSPNVIVEGRSPVVLRYSARGQTVEDESWAQFAAQKEPNKQLDVIEAYIREKAKWKEAPDAALLARAVDKISQDMRAAREKRPHDALACALALGRLGELGLPVDDALKNAAAEILCGSEDPAKLIGAIEFDSVQAKAIDALAAARTDIGPALLDIFAFAGSGLLDQVAALAVKAGLQDELAARITAALEDPVPNAEIIYWLWKGPAKGGSIAQPAVKDLFLRIIDALSGLGRTTRHTPDVMKNFRLRMKSALALRDFGQARSAIGELSEGQAMTLKNQLARVDLGDNTGNALVEILRKQHPQLWHKPRVIIAAWEDENIVWTTPAGLRRKTDERDILVNVTMRDNARRIGEAASHGDLSENSEYKFALEERDLLRARLAQMNKELEIAKVIDHERVPKDSIGVGSQATIRRLDDGAVRTLTFLGPFDADVDQLIYNYRAPISQKIMGRHVGERVVLTLDNRDAEYEITSITIAPQLSFAPAGA